MSNKITLFYFIKHYVLNAEVFCSAFITALKNFWVLYLIIGGMFTISYRNVIENTNILLLIFICVGMLLFFILLLLSYIFSFISLLNAKNYKIFNTKTEKEKGQDIATTIFIW
jgi:hypothetical protein